jgi:predicted dehydrogenase|tara:strand:- start:1758 stop:2798 length:1041 start_codon:yes stop_codon:yes gene_type:complete
MKKKIQNLAGLVIGCGSIGRRHINNLKNLGVKNLSVFDKDKKLLDDVSKKYSIKKFDNLQTALSFKPDFSVICTFPKSHIQIANQCLKYNSNILIEKPLSSDLKGITTMLNNAKSKNLKVAVGYNLRFDKGLILLKQQIQKKLIGKPISIMSKFGHNIQFWRPGTDYKNHYILQKGSGIILDGSHEYDYLRWLFEDEIETVYCQTQKNCNIKTETESFASMILKFKKGLVANVNIDYLRPTYQRGCYILGEKGSLRWEYNLTKSAWSNYSQKVNSKITLQLISKSSNTIFNNKVQVNDMYVSEMKNFIESILLNKKPSIDGLDGLTTLEIGIASLKSAKKNQIIKL